MRSGYPSDWDERRRRVYERDDYECQRCGRLGGPRGGPEDDAELHAHHIVPKSEGGTDDISNLETLCHSCHNQIHGHKIDRQHVDRSFSSLIEKSRKSTSASSPSAKSEGSTSQIEKPTDSISYSGYAPDSRGDNDSEDSQSYSASHSQDINPKNPPMSDSHNQDDSSNSASPSQTTPQKITCTVCGDNLNSSERSAWQFDPDETPDTIQVDVDTFYVCGSCAVSHLNQMAAGEATTDNKQEGAKPVSVVLVVLLITGIGWYFLSFWAAMYYLTSLLLMMGLLRIISRMRDVLVGDSEANRNSKDSESNENNDAAEKVDELLDVGESEQASRSEELGDEAWRRKQDQGTIEDRRGPGRF